MSDLSALIVLTALALFLLRCVKIVKEGERGVVYRFGSPVPTLKGPGIVFVFDPIDVLVRVSLTPAEEMELSEILGRLRYERSVGAGTSSTTAQEFAERVERMIAETNRESG